MVSCLEAQSYTTRPLVNQVKFDPDQLDLSEMNRRFESATPQEILAWAVATIPNLAQMTSFSMGALTHMLYHELQARVPVIFLDTLHLFPETLETAQKAKGLYNLDLHVYQAAPNREHFIGNYGDRLWEKDVVRFHELTKVQPMERALNELNIQAWITGRRRDQSTNRQHMPILERATDGRIKINPLANWTHKDIWRYTFTHGVFYNPLHDQGYTSIGDQPLTTQVQVGEDERAGRWRGSVKTECGIHR
ncbi:phosphoadenosine phosphosulfate reductase [Leptothoe spongobia]|uniref:Phosphoadenosine 5'-phosphosulfate reductase n=1 Tax=Leptothoe spongobia TAU-MAC 1115 TaxID=1967444 RepID=A0A947DER4_9CYAN|nr:phosphoadenosine phosphosulfate reductase [Leptothoe spongobia]MBT9315692.1 phosphoadenosine phosphosulfate reductase [Leptothoe spongobia TAU-MAC 1115]